MSISKKKATAINVFFHYLQIALSLVTGILLVPVYLQFISISLYGAWLATGNIVIWLTMINPGLAAVLMQRVSEEYGKQNYPEIRQLISAGVLISAIMAILIAMLGLSLSGHIITWLKLDTVNSTSSLVTAYNIAVVSTSTMIVAYSVISINYGLQASLSIGVTYSLATILKIITVIYLLYCQFGIVSIAIAELTYSLIVLVGNIIYLSKRLYVEKIGLSFSTQNVIPLVKLLTFTFGARFSKIITKNMDSFMITRFLGPDMNAIFNITGRAMKLGETFISHPVAAFRPAISHLKGTNEISKAKSILMRLTNIIFWLTGLMLVGFINFNDNFINLWVGKELYAGFTINILLVSVFLLRAWATSLNSLCFALGNIKGNSIADLVQSLIYIPILYFGIKNWGLLGATFAPILSIMVVSAWYYPYIFTKQLKLIKSDIRTIISEISRTILAVTITTYTTHEMITSNWLEFTICSTYLIISYLGIQALLSFRFRSEVINMTKVIPRLIKKKKNRRHGK